jgi:hypothetical protein
MGTNKKNENEKINKRENRKQRHWPMVCLLTSLYDVNSIFLPTPIRYCFTPPAGSLIS